MAHPTEVTTDRAHAYPQALDELLPAACHVREKYADYELGVEEHTTLRVAAAFTELALAI